MRLTILLLPFFFASMVANAVAWPRPNPSWTPPPIRFSEEEWKTKSPSWSNTRNERGGTVVWFYKEMSQEAALPVLLRALDFGETWLQITSVEELNRLTIPLPDGFEDKLVMFYQSIDLSKIPKKRNEISQADDERIGLKMSLAMLLYKLNQDRGIEVLKKLSEDTPQQWVRDIVKTMLKELEGKQDTTK